MINPRLLNDINFSLIEKLKALSDAQIQTLVLEYFALWLPSTYADPDKLLYAGAGIAKAARMPLDQTIFGWISEDNSEKRLDIAAGFLGGYWSNCDQIDLGLAQYLIDGTARLPIDSDAYITALFALMAAFARKRRHMPDAFFSKGRNFLAEQCKLLRRNGLLPGMADRIEGTLRQ